MLKVLPGHAVYWRPLVGGFLLASAACSWAAPTAAANVRAQGVARIVQQIDESQRTEIKGHLHPALRASRDMGPADPALQVERLTLFLRGNPSQEADLEQFLQNVQTAGHPDYHHWLMPAAFAQRFGVATSDLQKLSSWLQSKGFRVDSVPAGGRAIQFSGSVALLDRVFGTRMRRFQWHGEQHLAASANPSIPSALAPVVGGFASLHDFRHRPALVPGTIAPDFTSGTSNFLAPGDFATIYDLKQTYSQGTTGNGRSIAVLGRSSVLPADLSNFRSFAGLGAGLPEVINNGPAPGLVSNDELESDLDLEWSAAVAPGASIKFVTSASTALADGIDLSAQYAVSSNVADIISLSYSSCESAADVSAGLPYYHQLWQQAAAQGISVFVSSGDAGAAGCDNPATETVATQGLAVNQLCSSPYSTCVGGTQFTADVGAQGTYWNASNDGSNASAISYIGESVWNQSGSNLYASGGGASIYYAKPAWQFAPGVPGDGRRDVPDLALAASSAHDAYLIYTSDGQAGSTLVGVGGTSASTPSMAGIVALAAQKQSGRLGTINPVLYALSSLQGAKGGQVFHRITSGNNSVPGQAGFSASTTNPGFSEAAGLGSVDGGALVAQWTNAVIPTASLAPTAVLVPAGRFVGSASLNAGTGTAWTASVAVAAASWLSVTPASGSGSAQLSFIAQANNGTGRSGTITVNGLTLTVTQAAGISTAGNLTVTPGALTFGVLQVGLSAPGQQVVIGNSGGNNLSLASLTLSGAQAGDFTTGGSCVAGGTLAAGTACFVNIGFVPIAPGVRSASLQISTATQTVTVALTGRSVSAPPDPGTADVPFPVWAIVLLAFALMGLAAYRVRLAG